MTQDQAKKIGRLWESGNMRRIYINESAIIEAIGLELDRYKTGNISSAYLNGKQISNGWAREIVGKIEESKFYFDLTDNTFRIKSRHNFDEYDLENALCTLADSKEEEKSK